MFMKEADPFQVESLPKAFYYPSKEKELSNKEKKVCLSVPVSSQQQVTSPEDLKFLKESNVLKVQEIPTRENGSFADQSSTSQFNESWPSTEQAGSLGTPLSEGTISSPEMTQQMREWLAGQDKPASNATLGWFINRFRNAPPTSRQHRDRSSFTNEKQSDFWWLSPPSGQSTPVLDTPPQKLKLSPPKGPSQKKHKLTISTPSPSSLHTSDNTTEDINRRAKQLLEQSETSIESCSTEPFPLPLKKPGPTMKQTPEPMPRQRTKPGTTHTTNRVTTPLLQHHNPWPEDDILYQWRLSRKMEQAQERASTMGPKGPVSLGVRTKSNAQGLPRAHVQLVNGAGQFGVCDAVEGGFNGLYSPQDHSVLHEIPSETLPTEHLRHFVPTATTSTTVRTSATSAVSSALRLPDAVSVSMVTPRTTATPIVTSMVSHPCRHLERMPVDNHTTVPPHMHLACDILPCPCSETVSKTKDGLRSERNVGKRPATETLSRDGCVYSDEEKERTNKTVASQDIRQSDIEGNLIDDSKSINNDVQPDSNGMENESRRKGIVHQMKGRNGDHKSDTTSDMVENIIGKVVSEHLFCGDTSSSNEDKSCRTSIESQSQHGSDDNGHTMVSSTLLQEKLLAESSEEEFTDDEIIKMLRERSKDLKGQLRDIDKFLQHNK